MGYQTGGEINRNTRADGGQDDRRIPQQRVRRNSADRRRGRQINLGLEADYATFSKRGERGDRDLFGQHLQSILLARVGPTATASLDWEFHTIDNRDVCRVHVEPSDFPVYEAKGEEAVFWWRYPTGTTAIKNDLERERIIARRWSEMGRSD